MFSSIDKALVALLGAVFFFLDRFAGLTFGLDDGTIAAIATALTPILVWLVPNKDRNA